MDASSQRRRAGRRDRGQRERQPLDVRRDAEENISQPHPLHAVEDLAAHDDQDRNHPGGIKEIPLLISRRAGVRRDPRRQMRGDVRHRRRLHQELHGDQVAEGAAGNAGDTP